MTHGMCSTLVLLLSAALLAVAAPAGGAEQLGVLRGGEIGAPAILQLSPQATLGTSPLPPVVQLERTRFRDRGGLAIWPWWYASDVDFEFYYYYHRFVPPNPYLQPYARRPSRLSLTPQPYPPNPYFGNASPQVNALPQYFEDASPYSGAMQRFGTPLPAADAAEDASGEQDRADARRALAAGEDREASVWPAVRPPRCPATRRAASCSRFACSRWPTTPARREARAAVELEPQAGNTAWIRNHVKSKAYQARFQALEQFVRDNRQSADGHFLLGYHYLILGKRDLAKKHLKQSLALQPGDEIAEQLLK